MPPPTQRGDGLSEHERAAYAKCSHLSCPHEACVGKFYNTIQQPNRSVEKCGHLMRTWEACFKEALTSHGASKPAEMLTTSAKI